MLIYSEGNEGVETGRLSTQPSLMLSGHTLAALMGWAGLEGKKLLEDIDNIQLGLGVECSKLPH